MRFDIQVAEEDYLRFNEHHMQHGGGNRIALNILRFSLPVISVAMIAVDWKNGPAHVVTEAVIMGALSALWVVKLPKAMKKLTAVSITLTKQRGGTLPYHERAVFDFDEECFTETAGNAVVRVKYTDVHEVVTTEDAVYIYLNPVQAFILPRRCTGERGWKQLNELLAARVQGRK